MKHSEGQVEARKNKLEESPLNVNKAACSRRDGEKIYISVCITNEAGYIIE